MIAWWCQLALAVEPTMPIEPVEPVAPVEIAADSTDMFAIQQAIDAQNLEIAALKQQLTTLQTRPSSGPRTSYGEGIFIKEGEIVDEVTAFGDDVRVDGLCSGDATSFGGDVIVGPTGQISGDATAFGGQIHVEDGGKVQGDRVAYADDVDEEDAEEITWFEAARSRLQFLLSLAGAGILVVGLVPDRVGRVAEHIRTTPLRAFLLGGVGVIVVPIVAVMFAITGLGIPISLVLFAALGLAWLIGFVGVCQAIGDRLPMRERHHGRWLAFALGTLAVGFFGVLPWIAWFVVIAGGLVGIGGAFLSRYGGR